VPSGDSSPQYLGAQPQDERSSASLYRGSGGRDASGVQGQNPWSGEAEPLLVFKRSIEAANLPTFLKFGNAKKSDICVILAKNHEWSQKWGAGAKLGGGGLCPLARA